MKKKHFIISKTSQKIIQRVASRYFLYTTIYNSFVFVVLVSSTDPKSIWVAFSLPTIRIVFSSLLTLERILFYSILEYKVKRKNKKRRNKLENRTNKSPETHLTLELIHAHCIIIFAAILSHFALSFLVYSWFWIEWKVTIALVFARFFLAFWRKI